MGRSQRSSVRMMTAGTQAITCSSLVELCARQAGMVHHWCFTRGDSLHSKMLSDQSSPRRCARVTIASSNVCGNASCGRPAWITPSLRRYSYTIPNAHSVSSYTDGLTSLIDDRPADQVEHHRITHRASAGCKRRAPDAHGRAFAARVWEGSRPPKHQHGEALKLLLTLTPEGQPMTSEA